MINMIQRSKLIPFMFILLFFLAITTVNAAQIDDTGNNTQLSHKSSEVVTAVVSQPDIKVDENIKMQKNIKKEQTRNVSSFDELYDTIEDIKTNSNETSQTINLNAGNYNITKTINWGNTTHTTKTLTINGNNIKVDGQRQYQFMSISNNYTLNIYNNILENCSGSVFKSSGNLTIINSNFKNNNATSGGVVYNEGFLVLRNSNLTDNHATNSGASIYNKANASITNTLFKDNTAKTAAGVYNDGGMTNIIDSNFISNIADNGGALLNSNNGTMNIIQLYFFDNNATVDGGVLYNKIGNLNIIHSNFTNNNAKNKASVVYNSGSLLVDGCILSDNYDKENSSIV